MNRNRWLVGGVFLAACVGYGKLAEVRAGEPIWGVLEDGSISPRSKEDRYRIRPPRAGGQVLATTDGMRFRPVDAGERRLAASLLSAAGSARGGGADVEALDAVQISYSDPTDGNVVLLLWTETTSNDPAGVEVLVDGVVLGSLAGLPAAELPGTNGVQITNLEPATYTFGVRGGGTSAEKSQAVVAEQPFSDAGALQCAEGEREPGPPPTCELLVSWTNPGPLPTVYWVLADGAVLGELSGTAEQVTIGEFAAGDHCATIVGFLTTADGEYRGGFPEVCCDLTCEDLACNPPYDLSVCQVAYGAGAEDGALLLDWRNGEAPYAGGINVYLDETKLNEDPVKAEDGSDLTSITIGLLPPGAVTVGVQGDCGPDGQSTITESTIQVLEATPHPSPVSGTIDCVFDSVAGATTATWTPADPSTFIDVYVFVDPDLLFIGTVDGDSTSVSVTGTTSPDEVVVLQFFTFEGGACYGSERVMCSFSGTGNRFIRGICNGVGLDLEITAAIFELGFLFLGGNAPPCNAACDVDADGQIAITDPIYILNYLFLGGPAPRGWEGGQANCETAPPDVCARGNPVCSA